MNNIPRQTLRRILAKHGKEIAGDVGRCKGLLNDLSGAYRRENNVLVTAVEERIPLDLLAGARSLPTDLLLTRLEKRLADQTGLTPEAARWAVESWALALGVATDSEIAARESKQINHTTGEPAKILPPAAENKPLNQKPPELKPVGNQPPTKAPINQATTKQTPPARRAPAKIPVPSAPPVHLPANNASAIPTTVPNYPTARKTPSWLFRGCLVFVFLLIVSSVLLLFGVPFALEKMRETQRERQNDPPRFPVR